MTLEGLRRAAGSLLRRARVVDARQRQLFDDDGQVPIDDARPRAPVVPADAAVASGSAFATEAAAVPEPALAAAAVNPTEPVYRHPQATRQLRLAGHDVAYAFVRARRRSIGMVVGPEGLSVRAPRWVSLREVEAALHERAAWIVEHLAGQRERAARAREHDEQWCDGGTLRVLGAPVKLVLDTSIRGCVASWAALGGPPAGATLRVGPSHTSVRPELVEGPLAHAPLALSLSKGPSSGRGSTFRRTVEAWLQAQAATLFAQRCAHFAPLLGVQVRRIGLSGARTRWGSAGIDGSIRLNWRLMHHPMDCVDYVVVHELAHLRHMNHGPAFWRLVESVIPDHRALRKRLRDEPAAD